MRKQETNIQQHKKLRKHITRQRFSNKKQTNGEDHDHNRYIPRNNSKPLAGVCEELLRKFEGGSMQYARLLPATQRITPFLRS